MSDYELTDEDYDAMAEATHLEYLEDQQALTLDFLLAENERLTGLFAAADRKLALIEVVAALWEAGARQLSEESAVLERQGDLKGAFRQMLRAQSNLAHTDAFRDILREG